LLIVFSLARLCLHVPINLLSTNIITDVYVITYHFILGKRTQYKRFQVDKTYRHSSAPLSLWVYAQFPSSPKIPRLDTICSVKRNLRRLWIVRVSYGRNILRLRRSRSSSSSSKKEQI
jgi:hypothetical protein